MFCRLQRFVLLCFLVAFVNAEEFQLSKLAELDENNWRSMLEGEWMVEFFAPWCPACKSLAPTWEKFAKAAGSHKVHVGRVDVTKSPSLSGRFFVTALPTIYHVFKGEFRQYRGSRDIESFINYINHEQWQKVEPLSAWKQPDSIHMSILSYFFKLSHYLKDMNTRLLEEYGVPTWGSYALFAIATIFIGALLGLILVCIVDFLYPPKKSQRQSFSEIKEKEKEGGAVEEIPADELEDEDQEEEVEQEQPSTSEGEKNSNSESEEEGAEEDEEEKQEHDNKLKKESTQNDQKIGSGGDTIETAIETDGKTSPEVRKRKPRKAD